MENIKIINHIYTEEEFDKLIHNLTSAQRAKISKLSKKIRPITRFTDIDIKLQPTKFTFTDRETGSITEFDVKSDEEVQKLNDVIKPGKTSIAYKKLYFDADKPVDLGDEGMPRDQKQVEGSYLGYIKRVSSLYEQAFNWNPSFLCKTPKLVKIAKVQTYHTYGYPGFVKPTIAEVLVQLPEDLQKEATAFEFGVKGDDIYANLSPSQKHHNCYVNIYKLAESEKEPQEVIEEYGE